MGAVWQSASQDAEVLDLTRASAARIQAVVGAKLPRYPNYAITGTPIEDIYGHNVEKLHALAEVIDPEGVMKLAGGFKL